MPRTRRAAALLLALAALLQCAAAAWWNVRELERLPQRAAELRGDAGTDPGFAAIAMRTVPALAAAVPEDARVLVITSTLDVPFDFLLLPRRIRLLHVLPPGLLEMVRDDAPEHAAVLEWRLDELRERGQIATPRRLRREVGRADRVLTFFLDDAALAPVATELVPVAREGPAALYRTRPR